MEINTARVLIKFSLKKVLLYTQPWIYSHPLGQTHCRQSRQTQKIDSLREKPFNESVSPFRRVKGSIWRRERNRGCNEKNEKGVLRFDLRSTVLALLTFALISSYVSEITSWTYKRHLGFFARYGLSGHVEGSNVSALNYFLSSLLSFMLLVFVVSLDCQWSPKEIVSILLGSRLDFCAWISGSQKNAYCLQWTYNLQMQSVSLKHVVVEVANENC